MLTAEPTARAGPTPWKAVSDANGGIMPCHVRSTSAIRRCRKTLPSLSRQMRLLTRLSRRGLCVATSYRPSNLPLLLSEESDAKSTR